MDRKQQHHPASRQIKKPLILIKLGGSIITNKEIQEQIRWQTLRRLIREIAASRALRTDVQFVVVHGQGSFAHFPAKKYGVMGGFPFGDEKGREGMAIVLDTANRLNRIIVAECLKAGLPAVSYLASNTVVTHSREQKHFASDTLEELLRQGMMPVSTGDVVVDDTMGCTVWSAEEVLSHTAVDLQKKVWIIQSIVHITETDGVYDENKRRLDTITPSTVKTLNGAIHKTKGCDVTGGMQLKIQQSLDLLRYGIPSIIVSGKRVGNVRACLSGKKWIGTKICGD